MPNLFKDMLKDSESLFKNPIALDYDYQPKLIPYRDNEQHYIASCIKPLLQDRNGKNLFIFGKPGVGKTVATKHVLQDLEENHDGVQQIYINCWKKDTPYKVVLDVCEQIGYKWIQQKKTEELFQKVKEVLNKTSTLFVLDEADKLQDTSIIYSIIEDIYKKTILLITNEKDWINTIDKRLLSRLVPELLEFKPYNQEETKEILKQRAQYAFNQNIFEEKAFNSIAEETFRLQDIRTGLFLLKESALIAENKSLKKIKLEHSEEAIKKLATFTSKDEKHLQEDEKQILELIKGNSGKSIKDLYSIYSLNNSLAYRTFQRKIKQLETAKQITLKDHKDGWGYYKTVEFGSLKTLEDY